MKCECLYDVLPCTADTVLANSIYVNDKDECSMYPYVKMGQNVYKCAPSQDVKIRHARMNAVARRSVKNAQQVIIIPFTEEVQPIKTLNIIANALKPGHPNSPAGLHEVIKTGLQNHIVTHKQKFAVTVGDVVVILDIDNQERGIVTEDTQFRVTWDSV